jgi:CPA2 family monovalent cation:H+ antiporter-2
MGVLLFQDLAVVPLADTDTRPRRKRGADVRRRSAIATVKAVVALSLILFFGQRLMRSWFHVVARARALNCSCSMCCW